MSLFIIFSSQLHFHSDQSDFRVCLCHLRLAMLFFVLAFLNITQHVMCQIYRMIGEASPLIQVLDRIGKKKQVFLCLTPFIWVFAVRNCSFTQPCPLVWASLGLKIPHSLSHSGLQDTETSQTQI